MTHSAATPASTPVRPMSTLGSTPYQPGVCNIGPAEIARRRRAGHVGALMTIGLVVGSVAVALPL
jgi:hypothetical protein